MRLLSRLLAWTLGLSAVVVTALAVHLLLFRPYSIDLFFERVLAQRLLNDPEALSELRLVEQYGITWHSDELTDISPAAQEKRAARERKQLETLRAYDRNRLTPSQRLSAEILEWSLSVAVEGHRWQYHNYPVNQLFGVQNALPTFMATAHPIADAGDARDYIIRLSRFDDKFAQLMEGLRLREAAGVLPPRFVIDKVLAEMRGFIGVPATDNILHVTLRKGVEAMADESPKLREQLLAAGQHEIEHAVYPAYGLLIEYFEGLQAKVSENYGVWKLPDGDAFYDWAARHHTTTDLDPEQIHQIGLSEVARIEAEMDAILRAQGYTEGSVGARVTALGAEPRFLYPDTAEGKQQILRDFQSMIDEIEQGLEPVFDIRPKMGVKVERIPEFKEQGSPGAYYNPPAMDGSRPGIFYMNLRNVNEVQKFGMRTLAYHEAIPGHHFQIAIQQELTGVPTFRKLLPITAYVEGWALYSELLAKELGYQDDPFNDLGRLQAEMFRAVRLVVDTGMHRKRWTREQAIAYMLEKTGQPESDITAEIERYLVIPGQALAYKIGMLKMVELRARARERLGERFDIRAFHNVVLQNGAMPLGILEQVVERWIVDNGG